MWHIFLAWMFAVFAVIEGFRSGTLLAYGLIKKKKDCKEHGVALAVNTTGFALAAALVFLVI